MLELTTKELKNIEGGVGFTGIITGIGVGAAAWFALEQSGEKIGEFIYNITH
ncbi:class IIb bacteriocin, lactobin A/cerein 7B family [Flammeovirga agarivorans]|uniref:Class IIb bacteriocin, lactobin A/cerein 7B family n=1 Tax=Flammeovirga agarivorans TaxID=2726742 RepID=A0A7X8XX51_9BACT|nr:class IIb bacteriocin, lactobin A/cerein 7B family [Flammeovirga agarivorans]NLR92884.1 class IIb bacteriocin, lactobin A/cerein 7B family [Flammeovirga agarivorans]